MANFGPTLLGVMTVQVHVHLLLLQSARSTVCFYHLSSSHVLCSKKIKISKRIVTVTANESCYRVLVAVWIGPRKSRGQNAQHTMHIAKKRARRVCTFKACRTCLRLSPAIHFTVLCSSQCSSSSSSGGVPGLVSLLTRRIPLLAHHSTVRSYIYPGQNTRTTTITTV